MNTMPARIARHLERIEDEAPSALYRSHAQLLREHGERFRNPSNHPRLQTGRPKFCFFNSYHAADAFEGVLHYVEGYVATNDAEHPVAHHAWVVGDSAVYDVTWPWPNSICPPAEQAELWGVRVPLDVLRAHWRTCGSASFFADSYHDYPELYVHYARWSPALALRLETIRRTHCLREVQRGHALLRSDGSVWHHEHLIDPNTMQPDQRELNEWQTARQPRGFNT